MNSNAKLITIILIAVILIVALGYFLIFKKDAVSHPKLGIVLNQLISARNYDQFAKANNLYATTTEKTKKVRVVIELFDDTYKLPSEFGTEESRYGLLIQALIKIDKLLLLADEDEVKTINAPSNGLPML